VNIVNENNQPDLTSQYQQKAADVGFDLTKQFLTLAFAGIAFVVGLTFNKPGVVSTTLLWSIVGAFCVSVVLGLVFLMRGVGQLGSEGKCDIYAPALRFLSGFQILFVLIGVLLLIPVLNNGKSAPLTQNGTINIQINKDQNIQYPTDPERNIEILIEGTKLEFRSTAPQNVKPNE
jgi:hypothetical protein